MTGVIYVGPAGRLMSLAVPLEGYDNPVTEFGSLHEALSGAHTKDVFGYKRAPTIPLDALSPMAWSWFEMMYRQALTPPYYLLDPRRRNRLGAAVSTTLSAFTTKTVFTPSSGTAVAAATTTTLLPSSATPAVYSPAPSLALTWTPTAAGTLLGEANPIPCLPGETLCFSTYVLAGAPSLELVPYSAAGVAGSPVTGTNFVFTTPARSYVTYTVPTNGSVAFVRPQLRVAAAGTVTTLAWQLSDAAVPESWVMGDGVIKFLIDSMPSHAEYLNQYTSGQLVLQEV